MRLMVRVKGRDPKDQRSHLGSQTGSSHSHMSSSRTPQRSYTNHKIPGPIYLVMFLTQVRKCIYISAEDSNHHLCPNRIRVYEKRWQDKKFKGKFLFYGKTTP